MKKNNRGEQDYWSRAWHELDLWKDIFAAVDVVVTEFADSHGATCEKWLHDTPSRILSWLDASGIGKHIELLLAGPVGGFQLTVSGGASEDSRDKNRRKWRYETLFRLSVPVDQAELRIALDAAYRAVSAWGEADLHRTARIAKA